MKFIQGLWNDICLSLCVCMIIPCYTMSCQMFRSIGVRILEETEIIEGEVVEIEVNCYKHFKPLDIVFSPPPQKKFFF